MSTDYEVWCSHCRLARHLGQAMGGGFSFGYGTNDVETQSKIMKFIAEHVSHDVTDMQGKYVDTNMVQYLRIGFDHPDDCIWLDDERNGGRE